MSGWRGRWVARLAGAAVLLVGSLGLTGCQFFFQCAKASCSSTTVASSTGDYAYVSNSTAGTSYLAGYEVSTGTPIALSGSPYSLGFEPSAIAITPNKSLMFIASATSNVVYAYTIASNGALTLANNGNAVANETAAAMDITADSNYLFVLSSVTLTGYPTVDEYSIASNGTLMLVGTSASALASTTSEALKVAPSGDFVVAALGSAGDAIFALTSEKLTSTVSSQTISLATGVADYGVTIDGNNVIYLARTGLVATYNATAAGAATQIANTNSATGAGDHSIALSTSGAYLYTGNAVAGTITGLTNSSGTLGVLGGYAAPPSVAAVAADNSGKYVIAAGYSTSGGVEEYSIGSNGALTSTNSSNGTGTTGITLLAVTH